MSTGTMVVIIVVVVVVAAVIAAVAYSARRRRLQQRFGPEYDRAVEDSGSKRKAEAELSEREKRVRHLDIQSLDPAARDSYASQWTTIQEQFVDSPADAVTGAQSLITSVMNDRGYPTEDAAQIMADLSVEHASTLEHFREAQDLSGRAAGGTATTEDLRQAMVHYRALFQELLGDPVSIDESGRAADREVSSAAEPVATQPDASVPADVTPADVTPADDSTSVDAVPVGSTTEPATAAEADAYPADTNADETMRTDTMRTDTMPADAVPARTEPATDGSAATYPRPDEPSANEDDENTPAGAGRLFRRR
jgi:hypothetical protein